MSCCRHLSCKIHVLINRQSISVTGVPDRRRQYASRGLRGIGSELPSSSSLECIFFRSRQLRLPCTIISCNQGVINGSLVSGILTGHSVTFVELTTAIWDYHIECSPMCLSVNQGVANRNRWSSCMRRRTDQHYHKPKTRSLWLILASWASLPIGGLLFTIQNVVKL